MSESVHRTTITLDLEKYQNMLLSGRYVEAELEIQSIYKEATAQAVKKVLEYTTFSSKGMQLIAALIEQNKYHKPKLTSITITLGGGAKIAVPSFYALSKKKKKGPRKVGPNGRGKHLLLSYWGFIDKFSPVHWEEVTRAAAAGSSYDTTSEDLQARGMAISSTKVDRMTQKIGGIALQIGATVYLSPEETVANKRVIISLDGGRIRSREWKVGRPKKGHGKGFVTPWREPKLLVIAVLDEHGEKDKKEQPIYAATMRGPQEVEMMLALLLGQLKIEEATEIVCIADGADWIMQLFHRIQEKYKIAERTTLIVDYFHATEHITEIVDLQTGKTEQEKEAWAEKLKGLLHEGKLEAIKTAVAEVATQQQIPEILKQYSYFEKRKEYMHYDKYREKKQPIGSGIVESAVKRVINQRIKSTGSFWSIENVERYLQARCALMAGRYHIFAQNILTAHRLPYSNTSQ